ncbi:MAG: hypothetical protein KDK75_17045, partial [Alphaproteobacteria bacterium]|nr:hypothetical protein [Alphaproteobacteria bacterium]
MFLIASTWAEMNKTGDATDFGSIQPLPASRNWLSLAGTCNLQAWPAACAYHFSLDGLGTIFAVAVVDLPQAGMPKAEG